MAIVRGFPKAVRRDPTAERLRIAVSGLSGGIQVRLRTKPRGSIEIDLNEVEARALATHLLEAREHHLKEQAALAAQMIGHGLRAIEAWDVAHLGIRAFWPASQATAANAVAAGCAWLSRRVGPWNRAERYFEGVLAVEAACRALCVDLPDDTAIFSADDLAADESLREALAQNPPAIPAVADESLDVFTL